MVDLPSHHLIYGTLRDYITDEPVVDTDDERYRQKLARFFVEEKGFARKDLEVRLKIETLFAGNFVVSKVDLVINLRGRRLMLVRYGPGSLVTRQRPALAAARVLDRDALVPLTVVSNGEDAHLLDSRSGKLIGEGLENLPTKGEGLSLLAELDFTPLPEARREPELRILNAFDREVCCAGAPCALPDAREG
jgi:hypothetical protein